MNEFVESHEAAIAEDNERRAFAQNRAWIARHELLSGRREHVNRAIDADHEAAIAEDLYRTDSKRYYPVSLHDLRSEALPGRMQLQAWREACYRKAVKMNARTPHLGDAERALIDEAHTEALAMVVTAERDARWRERMTEAVAVSSTAKGPIVVAHRQAVYQTLVAIERELTWDHDGRHLFSRAEIATILGKTAREMGVGAQWDARSKS